MLSYYQDNSTLITRAQQIYHVLIGLARNRQTIRYGDLGTLIGYGAARGSVLGQPIGYIYYWCREHNIPELNTLVVEKDTGLPASGMIGAETGVAAEHEKVFDYPWFSIFPPSQQDLR